MPPGQNVYSLNIYGKGALVSYLLDVELRDRGSSFDELMAAMYDEFALSGRKYTDADVLALENAISGADLGDFFDAYIRGGVELPLDGGFQPLLAASTPGS